PLVCDSTTIVPVARAHATPPPPFLLFNATPTPVLYTLPLHDALPISVRRRGGRSGEADGARGCAGRPCPGAAGQEQQRHGSQPPQHVPGRAEHGSVPLGAPLRGR